MLPPKAHRVTIDESHPHWAALEERRFKPQRPAPDAVLWRYMDISRFLALVASTSLHFNRADSFRDQAEGSTTAHNRALRAQHFNAAANEAVARGASMLFGKNHVPLPPFTIDVDALDVDAIFERARRATFVSCWAMRQHQSTVLWESYATMAAGVAIQTTGGRLATAMDRMFPDHVVVADVTHECQTHLGPVRYLDYQTAQFDEGTVGSTYFGIDDLAPVFHKRVEFDQEQEVRAVVRLTRPEEGADPPPGLTGMLGTAGLDDLIERIWVAPQAPNFVLDAVRWAAKQAGISRPVERSDLALT